MLHWVTPYYEPTDDEARRRLEACREKNLRFPAVKQVTYLAEVPPPATGDPRISVRHLGRRATFADFLALVAESPDSPRLFALTNSDILLTPDIARVAQHITRRASAIALTRRELDGSYPMGGNPHMSQDLWMLKAQPVPETLLQTTRFYLGVAGCENVFAAQLVSHGFRLWNPCLDARIYHNDPQPSFRYRKRYYGLYFYPLPCKMRAVETDKPRYQVTFRASKYELPVTLGRPAS